MVWRPADSETFKTLNIEFSVKHLSKQAAEKAHADASNWIAGFFTQRGFVLLPGDDDWEAVFWARHFAEMISRAQGVPLTCMRITGTTEGGQTFVLEDKDRRAGATAKAKAGIKAGVQMLTFAGE
jgi:hypothetical protein